MNSFRVLVVDDEPLGRSMLATLVGQDPDVASVQACGDARQVRGRLAAFQPHILFLDIEMPELGGMAIAESIDDAGPVVVFVTAFSQYATRAFDVSAVDYVLKPFSDARLREALARAKRRVRERRLGELASEVASLSAELNPDRANTESDAPRYLQRLALKVGDRSLVLKASEIVWIEAEDYYVLVHSARGRHLVRIPMTSLEEQLDPRSFVRVHRAAIVNLDEVREVDTTEGAILLLSDGARVPVSRSRRKRVEDALAPRLR